MSEYGSDDESNGPISPNTPPMTPYFKDSEDESIEAIAARLDLFEIPRDTVNKLVAYLILQRFYYAYDFGEDTNALLKTLAVDVFRETDE